MFTGIIEEAGAVKGLVKKGEGARLTVKSTLVIIDSEIGDSINVNGTCLTVVAKGAESVTFDISSETLTKTNLSSIKPGDRLNLERSLKSDSRLGGHFVTGHIDGIGRIVSKEPQGEFVRLEIEVSEEVAAYLVKKGSIAVDGISLTINAVGENIFSVMLIPHTLKAATLGEKGIGEDVNIEVDILARYAQRLFRRPAEKPLPKSSITEGFLTEHGFI